MSDDMRLSSDEDIKFWLDKTNKLPEEWSDEDLEFWYRIGYYDEIDERSTWRDISLEEAKCSIDDQNKDAEDKHNTEISKLTQIANIYNDKAIQLKCIATTLTENVVKLKLKSIDVTDLEQLLIETLQFSLEAEKSVVDINDKILQIKTNYTANIYQTNKETAIRAYNSVCGRLEYETCVKNER